ncbi:MAG: phytoene/squalene synthase family protein [Thiomargarita sp.]|nr:phytoene/squalene synthase family protein [Thiomargarita sp.]
MTDDELYQSNILQGVSRTFALTIPQLPPELYTVVANGYLLCRIIDTIEDEPNLTLEQQQDFFQRFTQVVKNEIPADKLKQELFPLLSNHTIDAEKDLIFNIPCIIRLTHSFTANQQVILSRCVTIMSKGMAKFQQKTSPNGLKNLQEMDSYCYYVAGVVGETLTDLFCDYSPEIAQQQKELQKLAVSFGQALQMTNILKDVWEDQTRGACWLPQEIFAKVGFDLTTLSLGNNSNNFGEGIQQLVHIAYTHCQNALNYILLIPNDEIGIRRFCLWALGMAILTLRRISKYRNSYQQGQQVKISRRSVKTTILISNLATKSDRSLKILFYLLKLRK